MSARDDEMAVDYMMRRSIALLLSDLRLWKRDLHTISYGVKPGCCEDQPSRPLLGILVLAFNLWSACREIESLLPELNSLPQGWERHHQIEEGDLQGSIDWPKTFKHRQLGGSGYVVHSFSRKTQEQQSHYIAMLLSELSVHCDIISRRLLDSFGDAVAPTHLIALLQEIESTRNNVVNLLEEQYSSYLPPIVVHRPVLEEALTSLTDNLERPKEAMFLQYECQVQIKPPAGTSMSDSVMKLRRWRERYLACNVWLSGDDVFDYRRTGSVADLYEMWCFFEICSTVLRLGLQEIVQLQFLRRGQTDPQFRFGPEAYVYFDYRTSSLSEVPIKMRKIRANIPGVFVEWFFLHESEYERSMCLDVKYALWESRDLLKIMGYMVNFGIKNGALVIRDQIRSATLGGDEIVPGLRRVQLAPADSTLWVLSLPPREADEKANLLSLENFVSLAFT